ncbi:DUF6326 family protein [Cognatiyoonia sp. IB215182]|uniref:DUF6326 family protein n=1 Tax=Cognatiyoonia sp. IB215182 TaxID=3097353 RepID=UPI002A162A89|nr:DUF6326 family protein [Cognatiyoonia sp. IB215182]MDX8352951.1 DUF6326 family protein [Cognatiyoonia sp. IB215182]
MQSRTPPQDPRTLLSALWVFFLMNIIFRDIHQFLSPGYMDWVIAGEMFGRQITDELLLYGGFAVEVMIIMVIVPHILPRRAVRIVNAVAAVFTVALVLFTPPIDPDDVFFLVVGLATLAAILWFGWTKFSLSIEETSPSMPRTT